jgi:hypothetical protein
MRQRLKNFLGIFPSWAIKNAVKAINCKRMHKQTMFYLLNKILKLCRHCNVPY